MRHHPEHHEMTAQEVQQIAQMRWSPQHTEQNVGSMDEATLAARGVVEQMAEDIRQRQSEICL